MMASVGTRPRRFKVSKRDMRMAAQARLVVRAARQHHEHARTREAIKRMGNELKRGGVDPVHVLDDHQHRRTLPVNAVCL